MGALYHRKLIFQDLTPMPISISQKTYISRPDPDAYLTPMPIDPDAYSLRASPQHPMVGISFLLSLLLKLEPHKPQVAMSHRNAYGLQFWVL